MASESDDAASYAAIAKAATSPEDVEEALQAAEAAEQLAQTKGDAKGEACAAHSIALLKFRLEDFEEALAAGQRSCGLFRELQLEHLEARARAGLADAALRRRPPSEAEGKRFVDEAMDLAEGALQTFERLEDSSGRALALDLKVRAWMARGEHARAQEALEQTLESARGREDKVAEAAALQSLVCVHLARKTATAAIDCAQEAAKVQEMLGNQAAEAGAWHLAAQLLLKASNAPEALRCAQAARRVHKGCSVSATEEATVLQTLSAAHLASGDATKALEVANAGRELCKQEAAEGGEALCALRAASASLQLGDLEAALSAASDAQELFREVSDQRAEASAAHLVARIHFLRQDYSAARLAADTARALLRQTCELGREAGMLLLSSQAGSLELAAGSQPGGGKAARSFFEGRGRQKVLATSKEAVALSKRLSSNHLVAISRLGEARAKVSNGLLDEASQDLEEVLPTFEGEGDQRALGATKLLQANISILRGMPEVAIAKEALECLRAGSSHELALAQALVAKMSRAVPQARAAAQSQAPAQVPGSAAGGAPGTGAVAPKPAQIDKMALALPERVKYTLTELVAEAIGQEGMEEDRTLMETGMTSIASIMLRDKIQAEFPEIPEMDLTFVFDYPTIREMTGFVLTQLPNDA